jgi:hypothetical protein
MLARIRRVLDKNVHAERVDKAIPIHIQYILYCTVTVGEEPDIYIDIRYMCRPTLIFHKLCQYPFHTAPTSLLSSLGVDETKLSINNVYMSIRI